jgi:GDP-4-dehydro-6-deoxy-D-mannose reductase
MQTILVVGVNGFVGKHLARELHEAGLKVHGTGLDSTVAPDIAKFVDTYTKCDLTLPEEVATIPLDVVDGIINLAALATPSQTALPAELYFKVNVLTHTTLLDRLAKLDKKVRVLAVSTGAVYSSDQPMPLTETSELITDGSPYALSKIELEKRLETYRQKGQEIIIVRPLNHTGPGQGPGFIVPDLTRRILAGGELTIGPMNTSRDYTHVVDVVRAYRLLVTHEGPLRHTVYNICSGKATSRDELIDLIEKATDQPKLPTKVDPSIGRPSDPLVLYGSHDRITQELDWQPTHSLADTIQDYVDWLKSQPPSEG